MLPQKSAKPNITQNEKSQLVVWNQYKKLTLLCAQNIPINKTIHLVWLNRFIFHINDIAAFTLFLISFDDFSITNYAKFRTTLVIIENFSINRTGIQLESGPLVCVLSIPNIVQYIY